jgi:hypothetical protein
MTWDIEVGRAGIYEAVVYYTCPAGQTGSTIELSFHDAVLRGRISEAFDPPLVGETQDRAPRTESFSKDFKPLSLGTFRLPKLRGLLTLRAPEVHAQQVADVRYVALKFIA